MVLPATLLALFGACSVGEVNGPGLQPDANEVVVDGTPAVDAAALARDICAEKGPLSQAHNHLDAPAGDRRGLGCMDSGCHSVGGTGGAFTMSGTAYTTAAGAAAPQVGSIVRIFGMDGNTLITQAVTDSAGNFRSTDPIPAGSYITDITECGITPLEIRPMVARVNTASADMNCSRNGCHGSATPRIFLTGP